MQWVAFDCLESEGRSCWMSLNRSGVSGVQFAAYIASVYWKSDCGWYGSGVRRCLHGLSRARCVKV